MRCTVASSTACVLSNAMWWRKTEGHAALGTEELRVRTQANQLQRAGVGLAIDQQ